MVTKPLRRKNIVIATGLALAGLPGVSVDRRTASSIPPGHPFGEVPKDLIVIGAGSSASNWLGLPPGSQVTVVEFSTASRRADAEVAKTPNAPSRSRAWPSKLGAKVTGPRRARAASRSPSSRWPAGTRKPSPLTKVLLAIGRPFTEGLGLETVGITPDRRGRVRPTTPAPGVWAIGDVTHGPMLAHKAEEEAVAAIDTIAGKAGHVNYGVIPGVYTARKSPGSARPRRS